MPMDTAPTILFSVHHTGEVESYDMAPNASEGAPHIWKTLIAQYAIPHASLDDLGPLWARCGSLAEADNWVLAATFERAIVARDQLATYVKHLTTFVAAHPTANLRTQLSIMKHALSDDAVTGICWNQTLANDDPTDNWEVVGLVDDTKVTMRPYNITTDHLHWFVTPQTVLALKH